MLEMNSAPELHNRCTFQKLGTMPLKLPGLVFSVYNEVNIIDSKANTLFPRLGSRCLAHLKGTLYSGTYALDSKEAFQVAVSALTFPFQELFFIVD